MTKNDIINNIATSAGLTKADAGKALDAFMDTVTNALANGQEIRLVGFGTFSVTNRKATTGRNPRTGEPIKIAASKQAKFKAGKTLKEKVNS